MRPEALDAHGRQLTEERFNATTMLTDERQFVGSVRRPIGTAGRHQVNVTGGLHLLTERVGHVALVSSYPCAGGQIGQQSRHGYAVVAQGRPDFKIDRTAFSITHQRQAIAVKLSFLAAQCPQ